MTTMTESVYSKAMRLFYAKPEESREPSARQLLEEAKLAAQRYRAAVRLAQVSSKRGFYRFWR